MAENKIRCKVHEVGHVEQITDTFMKRELIVEYVENPQYPEYLKIDAINKTCEKLDELRIGDTLDVFINFKGRPHTKNGKTTYFNSLQLWKFDIIQTVAGKGYSGTQYQYAPPVDLNSSDDDDLPF